jgi:hypothetical protein
MNAAVKSVSDLVAEAEDLLGGSAYMANPRACSNDRLKRASEATL